MTTSRLSKPILAPLCIKIIVIEIGLYMSWCFILFFFPLQSIYYPDNLKKGKKESVYNFHTNSFPGHHETFSSFEESNIIYCT